MLERLALLIDADDTLWENNVYFHNVTQHYLDVLELLGIERHRAHTVLLETERRSIESRGYGSRQFALSVREAYMVLAPQADEQTAQRLYSLAYAIFEREEIELRPDVAETLQALSAWHRLILLTKGDPEEQSHKLECSGLRTHFEWVEIVSEKHVDTYRALVNRLRLSRASTWMIGNSPRSDINPALAAGLNAIYIPHPLTWEMEAEEIDVSHRRLTVIRTMSELLTIFPTARSA